MLSRILITCFFGSQHIDEFFFFFLPKFFILFFVSKLSKRKASRSSFRDYPLVVIVPCIGCLHFLQMRIHNLKICIGTRTFYSSENIEDNIEDNIVVPISNGRILLI